MINGHDHLRIQRIKLVGLASCVTFDLDTLSNMQQGLCAWFILTLFLHTIANIFIASLLKHQVMARVSF